MGPYFYVYLWLFMFTFSLFFMTIWPEYIAPLYNKYTPIEEGPVYDAIKKLADSVDSRGFFYGKKLENYVMYFIEGDTLQESLDQYDNVHTTSSPLCQYTWCFDIPGKCKGFLTWNLESIGCRGVDI